MSSDASDDGGGPTRRTLRKKTNQQLSNSDSDVIMSSDSSDDGGSPTQSTLRKKTKRQLSDSDSDVIRSDVDRTINAINEAKNDTSGQLPEIVSNVYDIPDEMWPLSVQTRRQELLELVALRTNFDVNKLASSDRNGISAFRIALHQRATGLTTYAHKYENLQSQLKSASKMNPDYSFIQEMTRKFSVRDKLPPIFTAPQSQRGFEQSGRLISIDYIHQGDILIQLDDSEPSTLLKPVLNVTKQEIVLVNLSGLTRLNNYEVPLDAARNDDGPAAQKVDAGKASRRGQSLSPIQPFADPDADVLTPNASFNASPKTASPQSKLAAQELISKLDALQNAIEREKTSATKNALEFKQLAHDASQQTVSTTKQNARALTIAQAAAKQNAREAINYKQVQQQHQKLDVSYINHCVLHTLVSIMPKRVAFHYNERQCKTNATDQVRHVSGFNSPAGYVLRACLEIAIELSEARLPLRSSERKKKAACRNKLTSISHSKKLKRSLELEDRILSEDGSDLSDDD